MTNTFSNSNWLFNWVKITDQDPYQTLHFNFFKWNNPQSSETNKLGVYSFPQSMINACIRKKKTPHSYTTQTKPRSIESHSTSTSIPTNPKANRKTNTLTSYGASHAWAPALELRDGAPAPRAEEQHGATVRRRHLSEFRSEALVVRVGLAPALPRQAVDLLGLRSGLDAFLGLHLQIKLHGLLQALAARVPAAARARAATEVCESGRGGEEEDEGEKVGEGEVA
jgi:hypothetical protein